MVIHFQAGVYLKLYVLNRLHSEHHGGARDPHASFRKMPGPGHVRLVMLKKRRRSC
ncbi:hypothetical protein SAMN05216428_103207 [Nitrosospira sp. Nsp11]|nr:hypothetical protein SAMN05216428_103207 [Nitrosospira sp. Nsp11]